MATKLTSVGGLKKGQYVVIEGVACKITDLQTSRPGKHGHAKVRLTAAGLLDDKKRQIVMPGHDNIEVPMIEKKNAQVLSIAGSKANVMDMDSYETFDLDIPEELRNEVTENKIVLYWDIMGEKVLKQIKSD